LLLDGSGWRCARNSLKAVLNEETIKACHSRIYHHVEASLEELSGEVDVYPVLRDLATDLTLMLFLDLDHAMESEQAQRFRQLARDHWRGLVTVQHTVSPQFRRAVKAKEELHAEILERLKSDPERNGQAQDSAQLGPLREEGIPLRCVAELGAEEAAKQLLLLVSALVPKALASLLTSVLLQLGQKGRQADLVRCREDKQFLERFILEVQRLYPPFFGGFRVCAKDCTVAGFKLQKGQSVLYPIQALNRDPAMFKNPDLLDPSRWENPEDLRIWTYGGGCRECLGQQLSNSLITIIAEVLLQRYTFTVNNMFAYKWLPVAKPTVDCKFIFSPVLERVD